VKCLPLPASAGHSLSIINKLFFILYIQWHIFLANANTMKYTMLKISSKVDVAVAPLCIPCPAIFL
jgi:hypothetical protein